MKFFLRSLFQSFYSPKFYKDAVARPVKSGLKVFFLFVVLTGVFWGLLTSISFVGIIFTIDPVLKDFPSVEVTKEGLSIEGLEQPFYLTEGTQYVGIDTTGEVQEIPAEFMEGVLIRKDDIVFRTLEEEEDRILTYSELLTAFSKDSIAFDRTVIGSYIKVFSVLMICFLPFWGVFVNIIVLGFKVFVMTLLGAIIIGFLNKENAFENAFKLALYISIPIYIVNAVWNLMYMFISQIELLLTLLCVLGLIIGLGKWIYFSLLAYYGVYHKVD
jgi:hypothetical protein